MLPNTYASVQIIVYKNVYFYKKIVDYLYLTLSVMYGYHLFFVLFIHIEISNKTHVLRRGKKKYNYAIFLGL